VQAAKHISVEADIHL